jgi:exodeoxyribonuclease III
MRIVTWNINSIRLRMPLLKSFCDEYQPDVIAIQETKVADPAFPLGDCIGLGYQHVRYSGEKSYNGVAILSKHPIEEEFCLEFYNQDKRHIAAKIKGIEIHNFYVPAGGDEPDVEINLKFKHKLAYLDSMNEWFLKNRHKDQEIILVGDLNIAPLEHDVWSSKQLKNVVSHTDIERAKLNRNMNEFGFVDAPRLVFPEREKLYSWWSYRNLDWEKSDRGRRLDHIWITPNLAQKPISSSLVKSMRKSNSPSDHVPVIVDI